MLNVLKLPLLDTKTPQLELHIEPVEGFEKGVLQLQNVTIFKTPSGTILIYANEN